MVGELKDLSFSGKEVAVAARWKHVKQDDTGTVSGHLSEIPRPK